MATGDPLPYTATRWHQLGTIRIGLPGGVELVSWSSDTHGELTVTIRDATGEIPFRVLSGVSAHFPAIRLQVFPPPAPRPKRRRPFYPEATRAEPAAPRPVSASPLRPRPHQLHFDSPKLWARRNKPQEKQKPRRET